jgi:hypothetical protein
MPRGRRSAYRYRAWTHPLRVVIARPTARTIVLTNDETLEDHLLEEGVTSWPVPAEVHLYEAVPGTWLGHLTAAGSEYLGEPTGEAGDLGELTPETAGLLLGGPGLGSRVLGTRGVASATVLPGQRFFRVVTPGRLPGRRRVRRFALRLDATGAHPVLRVHLRIGERLAHQLAAQLDQRAPTQVVATFRRLLDAPGRVALGRRLARLRALTSPGAPGLDAPGRTRMAATLAEAMITAVAKAFPGAGTELARAARDPASGLTITFAFPFKDRAALVAGAPGEPTLVIRPGYHHD